MEPITLLAMGAVAGSTLAFSFFHSRKASRDRSRRFREAAERSSLSVVSGYLPQRSLFDLTGEEQKFHRPALVGERDGYDIAVYEWGGEDEFEARTTVRLRMPSLRLGIQVFSPDFVGVQPAGKWTGIPGSDYRLYAHETTVSRCLQFLEYGANLLAKTNATGTQTACHLDDEYLVFQFYGSLKKVGSYVAHTLTIARSLQSVRVEMTPTRDELARSEPLLALAEAQGHIFDLDHETLRGKHRQSDFEVSSVIVGTTSVYRFSALFPTTSVQLLVLRGDEFSKLAKSALGRANLDTVELFGLNLSCWAEDKEEVLKRLSNLRAEFAEVFELSLLLELRSAIGGTKLIVHLPLSPEVGQQVRRVLALYEALRGVETGQSAYR